MEGGPKHAPYDLAAVGGVGHEVEVRVFLNEDEPTQLIAECEFMGDSFGSSLSLQDLDGVERVMQIDRLVQGVAELVYDELMGTPVFREDDVDWTDRVDAQRSWMERERRPSNGWVNLNGDSPAPAPAPEAPAPTSRREPTRVEEGSVELVLSPEEAAQLARGEMPGSVRARILKNRGTHDLLVEVREYVADVADHGQQSPEQHELALLQLDEVISRFAT